MCIFLFLFFIFFDLGLLHRSLTQEYVVREAIYRGFGEIYQANVYRSLILPEFVTQVRIMINFISYGLNKVILKRLLRSGVMMISDTVCKIVS